jgi:hypothetical protein
MSRKEGLEYKVNCNIPKSLADEIDATVKLTGHNQADIIRACIGSSLATLRRTPGLIPLLQPGVLNTRASME